MLVVTSHFMIKRLLYILIILQITSHCIGQGKTDKTRNTILGLNAGSFISNNINGFNYFINLTRDLKKVTLSIGPLIGQRWKLDNNFLFAAPQSRGIGLTGLQSITRYYPKLNENIFKYFIQSQVIFQYYKDNGFDNYNNDFYKSRLINSGPFFGIGYKITFLKNFYFTQSASIGGLYKRLSIDFSKNLDIDNENVYFSWTTDLTLGYRFK
jgi:hypothetical protein